MGKKGGKQMKHGAMVVGSTGSKREERVVRR